MPSARLRERSALYDVELYAEVADAQLVYITTDKTFARFHAASYAAIHSSPAGDVYNVQPRGELHRDPDEPESGSYTCSSAVVVRVVERGVQMTRQLMLASSRLTTWEGGGRMYDAVGFVLPSPQMEEIGITAADLSVLGFLPDPVTTDQYAAQLYQERGGDLRRLVPPPGTG